MRPENSNDELVRRMISEVWNGERPDRLPEFWAGPTRAEAEQLHSVLVGAFPDLRITVEDTVADDDKVAARMTFRGTHRGSFRGIEPTGRPVEFSSIRIYRVEDGKVVQTWAEVDALGLLGQLRGSDPGAGPGGR
jgi:ketosteroid isomerase-like protein